MYDLADGLYLANQEKEQQQKDLNQVNLYLLKIFFFDSDVLKKIKTNNEKQKEISNPK